MTERKQRPAVFLDRDGTINEEVGYLDDPAKVVLIPGSADAIRRLNEAGLWVVVTSNQSGVARGYFSEDAVRAVNKRLEQLLAAHGAKLDALFYCPHHAEKGLGPYRVDCDCRKPRPGMIQRATAQLPIDLGRSYVVGDKLTDVELGKSSGLRTVLLLTGFGKEELARLEQTHSPAPDFVAQNLATAVEWILSDLEERGT